MSDTGSVWRSDQIDAEAADWWSRLELGTGDREAFQRWRDANPAHAVAFARVQANWEVLGDYGPLVSEMPSQQSRRRFLRACAAAAVAVVAGGGFYANRAMAWDHARTGIGESRRITLPDGSMLDLNTDTAVSWKFTHDARRIRLEQGEIAVALAPGAPAMLQVETSDLALSPGRFNARLQGSQVGLTVLLGNARLERGTGRQAAVALQAGQHAAVSTAGVSVQSTTIESRAVLTAWQSGDIIFQDVRLQNAVDDYNRYLIRKIVVAPGLRDLRVGGRFTTSDPSAFLQAVADSLDVRVRDTGGMIEIAPQK